MARGKLKGLMNARNKELGGLTREVGKSGGGETRGEKRRDGERRVRGLKGKCRVIGRKEGKGSGRGRGRRIIRGEIQGRVKRAR